MKPHEIDDAEAIGWHVIARGGDMTARVHPGMCLGEGRPGELSFESADAIVTFHLDEDGLSLEVVSDDHELFVPPRQRLRSFHVKPKTQVEFAFLGHGLYIDNDLAIANPPEDTIRIAVVGLGETLEDWPVAMGPVSAGHHPLPVPLQAGLPVDYLQREHALASADKHRPPVGTESTLEKRLRTPVVGTIVVVLAIAVVAILTQTRVTVDGAGPPVGGAAVFETPADAIPESAPPPGGRDMVDPDVLARFSVLLDTDPLPDKATIDFAVESLKSLRTAYPDDPRVPEALERLTERLVAEAKQRYEDGDAFLAGRLMEQASTTGVGEEMVDATLAYFAARAPGATREPEPLSEPAAPPKLKPMRAPVQELVEAPVQELEEGALTETAQNIVPEPVPAPLQGPVQDPVQDVSPDDSPFEVAAVREELDPASVPPDASGEEATLDVSAQEVMADLSEMDATTDPEVPEEDTAPVTALESPPAGESVGLADGVVVSALGAAAVAPDDLPEPLVSEDASRAGAEPPEPAEEAEQAGDPGVAVRDETVDQLAGPEAAEEPATLEELLAAAAVDDPGPAGAALSLGGAGSTIGAAPNGLEPGIDQDPAAGDQERVAELSESSDGLSEDVPIRSVLGEFVVGAVTVAPGAAAESSAFPDTPFSDESPSSSPEPPDERLEPMLAPTLGAPGADDLEAVRRSPDAREPEGREQERFYAFSRLTPTRMAPLEYPGRVPTGADGTVELEFTVTESGEVEELEVRGNASRFFIRAAQRTVRQWRFEPVVEEGKAVPVRTALRVRFRG